MTNTVIQPPQENAAEAGKTCSKEMNYCFWGKLIVAVPALPLIAYAASTMFSAPLAQCLAAGGSVLLTIYLAIKIDHLPALSGKVVKSKA